MKTPRKPRGVNLRTKKSKNAFTSNSALKDLTMPGLQKKRRVRKGGVAEPKTVEDFMADRNAAKRKT